MPFKATLSRKSFRLTSQMRIKQLFLETVLNVSVILIPQEFSGTVRPWYLVVEKKDLIKCQLRAIFLLAKQKRN
jgi:hypothetical protein